MSDFDPLRAISGLLSTVKATLVVAPDRFAPSTIYDVNYRVAVIACAFEKHARADVASGRRMQAARLKLYQFVATRPWLLPVLSDWLESDQDPQRSLLASQRLRRGFLGDTMHDDVIGFLVARRVLARLGKYVTPGTNFGWLSTLCNALREAQLFVAERDVIDRVPDSKITNNMLEGW